MKPKVLVVYHYFAHYRLPVMQAMMSSDKVDYVFLSGKSSDIDIKKVDFSFSEKNRSQGGVDWFFLSNFWFFGNFLWQKGLLKIINKKNYDAVIFLGSPYFLSTWVSVVFLRLLGKKSFFWTHGVVRGGGVKDSLRLFYFKLVDHILLYGSYAEKKLIKKGFDKGSLSVINNSLDYNAHISIRESLDLSELKKKRDSLFERDLPLLVFIGRLTPQKKLEKLLDLVLSLKKEGTPVNLIFIGDGVEKSTLEATSCRLGISSNVYFYGACHDEALLGPLIAMSDLCVSPGEVGLTAIHSLSYGTPVVTHSDPEFQMPEFESIVEGKTGSLFKRNDMESLKSTVTGWLKRDVTREDVRLNCYEIVDKLYNPVFQERKITDAVLKVTER